MNFAAEGTIIMIQEINVVARTRRWVLHHITSKVETHACNIKAILAYLLTDNEITYIPVILYNHAFSWSEIFVIYQKNVDSMEYDFMVLIIHMCTRTWQ
jgi:hypothetical protein